MKYTSKSKDFAPFPIESALNYHKKMKRKELQRNVRKTSFFRAAYVEKCESEVAVVQKAGKNLNTSSDETLVKECYHSLVKCRVAPHNQKRIYEVLK